MTPTARLRLALQWAEDKIDGELIEQGSYCRTHLGYDNYPISQRELDAICRAANMFYEQLDSPVRLWNSMGEIRFALEPTRKLSLEH